MMRTHAVLGGDNGTFGAMVEVHEHSTDGFDSIANVGGDTGFDKSDLLAKFRYTSGKITKFIFVCVLGQFSILSS